MNQAVVVSSHPGMGAISYPGGAAFRVWAPNAEQVYVAGTFNQWSKTASPLAREGNGYWSTDVSGAKVGDQYKYVIINGPQETWKIDPYARDVTNSVGNSVIAPTYFGWGQGSF
jgi:1,4-alpha-glucan branching enzyme